MEIEALFIGGSAGSIKVVKEILENTKTNLPIILGLHRSSADTSNGLLKVIEFVAPVPISEPKHLETIQKNHIYLAPPAYHLLIGKNKTFELSESPLVHYSRPSIDVLFLSAAQVYQQKMLAILLTGANQDGAIGMKSVYDKGGKTIVQHPQECFISTMPEAALEITPIHHVFYTKQIIDFLNENL